ncbi:MAG: carbohydrate kinase family protein [Actinomycetes bacterium]
MDRTAPEGVGAPTQGSILVVGEALVDLVPTPAPATYRALPGGSPANVAVGLARLGRPVELVTGLGEDPFGRLVHAHLVASGVGLPRVDRRHPTGLAIADLDAAGVARYDLRLDWDLSVPVTPPAGTLALHTGSLATVLLPGARAVHGLMSAAGGRGVSVSYDPNVRPSLLDPHGDGPCGAVAHVQELAALAHVVKASAEDLEWLYPGRDPVRVAEELIGRGRTSLVVVTLGDQGAYATNGVGRVRVDTPAVSIADTVGAGDAFTAGLIDALARAGCLGPGSTERLARAGVTTLRGVVSWAARIAAITCTRPGADPPTRTEAEAFPADAEALGPDRE